ncbi:hypothetical protein [Robbsia andropogonis]|uniref:hypothetical protein n=1 Tax=Robbsia andropogonis TaxID=28092 RepID=UPI00209E0AD2|nr:hypothetical protein [Robbsia andropogonis]MCP1121432.1 hypothetical protein [Robbsia andropogonis]MCP1131220.1 hypothetical protein [Robbsia andropogonis]
MTTERSARGKRIGIGARPPANPHAEAWIRHGDADALQKGDLYTPLDEEKTVTKLQGLLQTPSKRRRTIDTDGEPSTD